MSPFQRFFRQLRWAGFYKTWSTRSGGVRMDEWLRDNKDGRQLCCQLWEDGGHRINHSWHGCSDTAPTYFDDEDGLAIAIEHESTRGDSGFKVERVGMSKRVKVNLPAIGIIAGDIDHGGVVLLPKALDIRNKIRDLLEGAGFRVTGCGVGFGAADISAEIDGVEYLLTVKAIRQIYDS